jgi:repressor LexA
MAFANQLKKLRKSRGLNQEELAEQLGFSSKSTLSHYETGRRSPDFETLELIADYFNVDMNTLLDKAVDITPASMAICIKVYNTLQAGTPLEAQTDIIDHEDIPQTWTAGGREYFGVRIKNNCMEPLYLAGDTVIVRRQPNCESGDDVIVSINGYNAELKRIIKDANGIILQSLNPAYPPKKYCDDDDDNPITIIGVVVEIRRKMKKIKA